MEQNKKYEITVKEQYAELEKLQTEKTSLAQQLSNIAVNLPQLQRQNHDLQQIVEERNVSSKPIILQSDVKQTIQPYEAKAQEISKKLKFQQRLTKRLQHRC